MEIKINGIYKHFKGTYHRVLFIAKDSETLEDMVIYTHENSEEIWVRPLKEFISKVDKEKYPEVKQVYRFELQKED